MKLGNCLKLDSDFYRTLCEDSDSGNDRANPKDLENFEKLLVWKFGDIFNDNTDLFNKILFDKIILLDDVSNDQVLCIFEYLNAIGSSDTKLQYFVISITYMILLRKCLV